MSWLVRVRYSNFGNKSSVIHPNAVADLAIKPVKKYWLSRSLRIIGVHMLTYAYEHRFGLISIAHVDPTDSSELAERADYTLAELEAHLRELGIE